MQSLFRNLYRSKYIFFNYL